MQLADFLHRHFYYQYNYAHKSKTQFNVVCFSIQSDVSTICHRVYVDDAASWFTDDTYRRLMRSMTTQYDENKEHFIQYQF